MEIKPERKNFDVLIVGGGPAGASCAMALESSGLSVALLDRATFPRDKICGDALSVDVVNQLSRLSPVLAASFNSDGKKLASQGVRIYAPSGEHVDIPFRKEGVGQSGFIAARNHFDNLLFQHARQLPHVVTFESCNVDSFLVEPHAVIVRAGSAEFSAPLLVAADGAQSRMARQFGLAVDNDHHSVGLRQYYRGVKATDCGSFIELFFFQDILPGYLWIFRLPDDTTNVGIGMLTSRISQRRVNLRKTFDTLLREHPLLTHRFKDATAMESPRGFGLPLGSVKRSISGPRMLLTGDAAGLIDPFTGEGIGNAIRSGRIAADHIRSCFKTGNFSADFNRQYDDAIYAKMWPELRTSSILQRLCRSERLFNWIIRKANQRSAVHDLLVDALAHVDQKRKLTRPSFYLRLLFS